MASEHHWGGLEPDPETFFGFVYLIENKETGRMYIGKKNFFKSTGRCKSRAFDRESPRWRDAHWAPNDWQHYKSSSKDVKRAIKEGGDWGYTILKQYTNSRDLSYGEVEALVLREALLLRDTEGEYIYYNKAIPGIRFRPPQSGEK